MPTQPAAPLQIYAHLLDEDVYLCSGSTMYRVLAENKQVLLGNYKANFRANMSVIPIKVWPRWSAARAR